MVFLGNLNEKVGKVLIQGIVRLWRVPGLKFKWKLRKDSAAGIYLTCNYNISSTEKEIPKYWGVTDICLTHLLVVNLRLKMKENGRVRHVHRRMSMEAAKEVIRVGELSIEMCVIGQSNKSRRKDGEIWKKENLVVWWFNAFQRGITDCKAWIVDKCD